MRLTEHEARAIVGSVERFSPFRKLRNRISHEYAESEAEIDKIYLAVLDLVPELFDSVGRIEGYSDKFKQNP
jgi:hypothetical protein